MADWTLMGKALADLAEHGERRSQWWKDAEPIAVEALGAGATVAQVTEALGVSRSQLYANCDIKSAAPQNQERSSP